MQKEEILQLEAEVESLLTLTIRAHERFLFLRPMMVNQRLNERIASEEKGITFSQLRNWLYWGFVQELVKICSDKDERTPCISKMSKKLEAPETVQALEDKYSASTLQPEAELRSEFRRLYESFQDGANQMLFSNAAEGYKVVRHKLIAHNELRESGSGYSFFDLKELGLKYGDERQLLDTVRGLVDQLNLLVLRTDFSWDSLLDNETKLVCEYWEIDAIEA